MTYYSCITCMIEWWTRHVRPNLTRLFISCGANWRTRISKDSSSHSTILCCLCIRHMAEASGGTAAKRGAANVLTSPAHMWQHSPQVLLSLSLSLCWLISCCGFKQPILQYNPVLCYTQITLLSVFCESSSGNTAICTPFVSSWIRLLQLTGYITT